MLEADAFVLEYQLMCQDDFMERVLHVVPFKDRVCFNFNA